MKKKVTHVLKRFYSNSCTSEELEFLEAYLQSGDLTELEEVLKEDWTIAAETEYSDSLKENEIWLKIETIASQRKGKVKTLGSRKKKVPAFMRYAAIFIGIIVISVAAFNYLNNDSLWPKEIMITLDDGSTKVIKTTTEKQSITNRKGEFVATLNDRLIYNKDREDSNEEDEQLIFNTLYVPYGKKFGVVLSDGSEVYLNAGSSLKYPVKFIQGQVREVYLEGEGYFKIVKNDKDRFHVNTNGLITEVYGTEFNVSSYDNEETRKVVLVEGSVGIYKELDTIPVVKLTPNELATYSKVNEKIVKDSVDVSPHVAWIDGVLLFKNENFNNILRKLERHYDVKITNKSNLGSEKFTGRFETESLQEVLNTFKKITAFNYTIKNKEIIINP